MTNPTPNTSSDDELTQILTDYTETLSKIKNQGDLEALKRGMAAYKKLWDALKLREATIHRQAELAAQSKQARKQSALEDLAAMSQDEFNGLLRLVELKSSLKPLLAALCPEAK